MPICDPRLKYELPRDSRSAPVQVLQPLNTRTFASDSASAIEVSTFTEGAEVIRVIATVNTFLEFSFETGVTATTSSMFIPAGVVEYFRIGPNQYISILGADTTETGTVYISEMW